MNEENPNLTCFGFNFETVSSLTKRTITSNELLRLFEKVADVSVNLEIYREAIIEQNCLAKRT